MQSFLKFETPTHEILMALRHRAAILHATKGDMPAEPAMARLPREPTMHAQSSPRSKVAWCSTTELPIVLDPQLALHQLQNCNSNCSQHATTQLPVCNKPEIGGLTKPVASRLINEPVWYIKLSLRSSPLPNFSADFFSKQFCRNACQNSQN